MQLLIIVSAMLLCLVICMYLLVYYDDFRILHSVNIINFLTTLRDVGEDLERGRIYLPQEEIAAFGLTEEDLFQCRVTEKYKDLMKFQIQRARYSAFFTMQ